MSQTEKVQTPVKTPMTGCLGGDDSEGTPPCVPLSQASEMHVAFLGDPEVGGSVGSWYSCSFCQHIVQKSQI